MEEIMNKTVEKLDFVTTEEYTKEDVKRVQTKSVEMMAKIVELFDKYGIEYIIAHGTLLGLIRHEGKYIPWDDDCDLFVFDWCYPRAIEILRRELPEDMVVHNRRSDPIYWCNWTKIRDINSDAEESLWKIDRKFKYHGICIDLLRATPSTTGEYSKIIFERKYEARKEKLTKKRKKKNKPIAKRIRWALGDIYYGLIYAYYKFMCLFKKTKIIIANKDTVIETSFKQKDVFPLKKYVFEGVEVSGPKNPDGVLKSMYGDYMQVPPLEKRLPHFSSVTFFD